MATIKYYPLFHVQLRHNYYADGACRAVVLRPSEACAHSLRQYGLRFQPRPDGGSVYGRVEKSGNNWRLRYTLPENLFLQFWITDTTGLFYPITHLPPNYSSAQLMHFSNLEVQMHDGEILLTRESTTRLFGTADLVDKVQGSLQASRTGNSDMTAAVQVASTGFTLSRLVEPHQGNLQTTFDLRSADSGIAALLWNGTEARRFYLLPPATPPGLLGVVDVVHQTSLPAQRRFTTPTGIVNTRTFIVPFAAARPRWRYKIRRLFQPSVTTISVEKSPANGLVFQTGSSTEPDLFSATSTQPIALSEVPLTGLTLRNQSGDIIIPHLPNPVARQVATDSDGQLYADMLITI
jgi:hypothetical protein